MNRRGATRTYQEDTSLKLSRKPINPNNHAILNLPQHFVRVVLLTYITKSTALAAAAVARLMAFAGELLGEGVVTASGPSTVL